MGNKPPCTSLYLLQVWSKLKHWPPCFQEMEPLYLGKKKIFSVKRGLYASAERYRPNLACEVAVKRLNPLPNEKVFYCFKLKSFADNKINVT